MPQLLASGHIQAPQAWHAVQHFRKKLVIHAGDSAKRHALKGCAPLLQHQLPQNGCWSARPQPVAPVDVAATLTVSGQPEDWLSWYGAFAAALSGLNLVVRWG